MLEFNPRKYAVTLKLVFLKAVNDVYPEARVEIDHSLNNGTYGTIDLGRNLKEKDLEKINNRMKEIIEKDYEINLICEDNDTLKLKSQKIDREDIRKFLDNSGWTGMMEYEVGGYHDFMYEKPYSSTGVIKLYELTKYNEGFIIKYPLKNANELPPTIDNPKMAKIFQETGTSTGVIKLYELTKYNEGFIIKYPLKNANELPPTIDNPKMAKIFQETGRWNSILDVSTIGTLNEKVLNREIGELVRVNEALHHKNLARIADQIVEDERIKLVTIAGPSSSGKTTFSKRLYIHLRASGKNPIVISLDNYYIGRKNVPLDEYGNKDYETIEALDLKLLNENLTELIAGKEVEIPEYNFVSGEREKKGKMMKVPENGLIIIEGIHGLNERLTSSIPKENKFKVYVSCLTQLNIDNHNRVATSDVREIRKIQ